MANPLVSVIVPTYNRRQYICDAVDSILAQTYENTEVIIVDDGSTDDTSTVLHRYGSRIDYVRQNNAGPSAARNNGIKRASGDLIAFLDSDDIWLPEKLKRQVQLIEKSPSTGLVSCGYYTIDASGKTTSGPKIRMNYESKELLLKHLMVRNIVAGGSLLLARKECFDRLGLFDEDIWIGEDWDMCLRIAKNYGIKFVEEPLVKYRVHEGGNLCSNSARMKKDSKKVVKKNIEKRHLRILIKARSHIYLASAREYAVAHNRYLALLDALKSIVIYPMKTYAHDNKYRILLRCLLPSWTRRILTKLSSS